MPVIAILSTICFSVQLKAQNSHAIFASSNSTNITKTTTAVQLKWFAISAIGVSHFVVEKSDDGKDFNDIGIVMTDSNDTLPLAEFYFLDKQLRSAQTRIHYRLKQVLTDGSFKYIPITAVTPRDKQPVADFASLGKKK
jgi:hypothetical protein